MKLRLQGKDLLNQSFGCCRWFYNYALNKTNEALQQVSLDLSLAVNYTWQLNIFCFFAASAYGCFVFEIIGSLPQLLFPLRRHEFLTSLHSFS